MSWDAQRYEQWFGTPEGQFAMQQEMRLLGDMISGWPRRNRKLLEIGCGTGLFLEKLWDMGFDVTGVDKSPAMLEAARKRFSKRAALHLGNGEHLPFADDEFDYVLLWTVLEFTEDPAAMLREAARVAESGILIGFLNRFSLYSLSCRGSGGSLDKASWFSPPQMRSLVRAETGRYPGKTSSVLPGPPSTWNEKRFWKFVNSRIYPSCCGSFVATRVDFKDIRPLNPLHAWKKEPGMAKPAP